MSVQRKKVFISECGRYAIFQCRVRSEPDAGPISKTEYEICTNDDAMTQIEHPYCLKTLEEAKVRRLDEFLSSRK